MSFLKKHADTLTSIIGIFLLFVAYNSKLALNLSTALTDWLDYPLIVFILEQNIKHISQLDFANWANISSYYPSPGGMFFTDILLVQGVIGTLVYPFTQNYILTHNLIFFFTALTNIISLQYFWKKLFKSQLVVSLLTLLFVFSPYYFTLYVHYQMLPYSLFFFSAGILLSATKTRHYFWAGIISGFQFLAGVYLGFYSLMFTGLFLLWKLYQKETLKKVLIQGTIYGIGFLVIAGFFVFKYTQIKTMYGIDRDAGMYIDLAIQPSDILFNPYPSLWSKTVYTLVNVHNHRRGTETYTTGWVLLGTTLAGLWIFFRKKQNKARYSVALLMLLILIWGVIGALGPRLTINGRYLAIPLPYILPLKLTPFFDALRATGRWFFFIQIGMFYFIGQLLRYVSTRLSRKKLYLVIVLGLTLYLLEMLPLEQRTGIEIYRTTTYMPLEQNCQPGDVLLEYPFRPMHPKTHVTTTLNYWVKMLLNQMHHECAIVNGYSGFDPAHFTQFQEAFETAVWEEDTETLTQLLEVKEINYLKLNNQLLTADTPTTLLDLVHSDQFEILLEDENNLVVHKIK